MAEIEEKLAGASTTIAVVGILLVLVVIGLGVLGMFYTWVLSVVSSLALLIGSLSLFLNLLGSRGIRMAMYRVNVLERLLSVDPSE